MFHINLKRSVAIAAFAGLLGVLAPSKSEAAFIAYICDDAACSGGGDTSVTDIDGDGLISLTGTSSGLVFVLNLAQSKPLLAQGMDLNYVVSSGNLGGGTVYLYAADTNFVGPASLSAFWGGTNDALGSSNAEICTGAAVSPSAQGSCVVAGSQGPGAFGVSFGPLAAATNPYSAMLGVLVTINGAGKTASGDLRMNVPEPSTLALLGLAVVGLGVSRRRKVR